MRDKRDTISVLFIGDIIGRPGRNALRRFLPGLRAKYKPSFILANGENAAGGTGITAEVGKDLFAEVDALTGGNHIWDKKEALPYLEKETRLLRPANYPPGNPGRGATVVTDAAVEPALLAELARRGTPIGPNDLMIAAIALAYGFTLVTHNTAEFARVPGLLVENWRTA